jgi:BASS family bile acid:Na+ symporter
MTTVAQLPPRFLGSTAALWMAAAIVAFATEHHSIAGALLALGTAFVALSCAGHRTLRSYAFPAWVFTFVAVAILWPKAFGTWLGYDLRGLIVPLVQIITFGMGTTLGVADFRRVLVMPWPVFIGLVLQFSVMPLVGYTIAMSFGFPPEIAAGVVLIGSVSGGVASNLITYLAGGNVALSVTMTACSTMMAPLATPTLMKLLAGQFVPISFVAMMLDILNMIIVPIVAGLVANRILYGTDPRLNRAGPLASVGGSCAVAALLATSVPAAWLGAVATIKSGAMLGLALISVVAFAKLIVNTLLDGPKNWMDRALPVVSMAGICFIIAIITARSRDKLLTVGLALIGAAILHNGIGCLLGYWVARAVRLDETSCRTIAIEVGMQNGGMATGLAMNVLKSVDAALAPAIFGPWMNIAGAVLASWWRKRPSGRSAPP